MKTTRLKVSFILLFVILWLGFVLTGCKKGTPSPQKLTAQEKAFLSAPDVVTSKLKKVKISKLDLPNSNMASFIIRYMEKYNRHYVKQTKITLANRPFKIILGHYPEREFYVFDIEKGFGPFWVGSHSLHSYHKIDDKFFEFMLIENDTKIAARPYRGPLGTIKVGKGGRELGKVQFKGSVNKQGNISVPIGTIQANYPGPVGECSIPIGDYTAHDMIVTYDNLSIWISNIQYSKVPGHRSNNETIYGIQVREDKPYVLDFSNEPMVIFTEPDNDKTTFKRGEEIKIGTVLIDPKLAIMINRLYDTSIKVDKEYKDQDGKVSMTVKQDKPIDINVVITRANGDVIDESKWPMPFG